MNTSKNDTATLFHLLLISAIGALIYANTLTAAFQFDDRLNIVDNLLIRDLGNLWPPTGARWFGTLTFALNYLSGGLNPLGYHLVNICIHILCALSVYFFVLLTFRTPYVSAHKGKAVSGAWFAFACALLFVAHPLQTQAVTYIVQRFASLAALLFMLSLDCYILARQISATKLNAPCRPHRIRWFLYALSALFALLSLKTKENAYTLPVVVLIYDVMFIGGLSSISISIKKRRRTLVPLAGVALACILFIINRYGLTAILDKLRATNEISRHDYLVTQFRVIVTYLRLLFFPVGQTIDHHYRVYTTLLEPAVLASFTLIILLLAGALYLYKLSRQGNSPYVRLISFGILWFFVTLSVESSIIPIIDIMFEHRMYLPSIGAILTVMAMCAFALEKSSLKRSQFRTAAAGSLAVVIIALAYAAHERNKVWKDELTLWSDVIAKTPRNPRGYNMLGNYYQAKFRIYDAIYYFRKALEVDASYAEARSNLGNAYIQTGRIDEGLNELMITAQHNRFDEIDSGILYYNIARGYYLKGMPDPAIEFLNRALRYVPNEAAYYFLLGQVYQRKNLPEQSAANFKKAHDLDRARF